MAFSAPVALRLWARVLYQQRRHQITDTVNKRALAKHRT
jgi:hypothetical protein